ncbi:MAG: cohesin domain-containing protein [Ardenticatenales bacterium]
MDTLARAVARPASVAFAAAAVVLGLVWSVVYVADATRHLAATTSSLQQAGSPPQSAPLPHYTTQEDANSQVFDFALHFESRRKVTVDPPSLYEGKSHISLTAPPQLQLELYDRAGTKLRTVNAWHPLRIENVVVPRPTDRGPALAIGGAAPSGVAPNALTAPNQADPHFYDPYQIIGDSGDGHLFLPFDPRISSVRIVDVELGGVELAKVSVEGAARRYCAQQPTIAFCMAGAGGFGGVSRSTLYLDPYTMTVGSSAVFTIDLKARKMVDLYGGQLAVTFDPKVLQVVDQDPGRPGAQIVPADFPKPDTVLRNAANNATGRIEYFFTLTGEKPGVNGAGTLAHLVMRGVGPGRSLMAITDTVLSDPQSLAIPTKTENALITVLSGPAADVVGQVELERRPTSAGARVCSGGTCVVTDAAGRFRLVGVPAGQAVNVTHPSYLRAQRLLPANASGTVTWPKVKLLAGDFDKDDRVDIVDAVMIGQRFNLKYNETGPNPRWLSACDITDDKTVNILDMTGVQFNMLKKAPSPWPATLAQNMFAAPAKLAQSVRVHLVPGEAHADGLNVDIPVELRIDDVSRLYGYRVQLHFDPTLLQVKDVSPGDDGVQVALGEFLDPINSFVLLNRTDNATGTIDLSVTQTAPAPGANGGGLLATITFRGRAGGTSQVTLPEVVLVDDTEPQPMTIPSEQSGATITVDAGSPSIYLPWTNRP